MTTYIGLLRAVNLGAHNKIAMADLRTLLGTLGMKDARTVLQSGNAVFRSDVPTTAALEQVLERGAVTHLQLATEFMVRTAAEWKAVIAGNPFPDEAERDPGHLVVMFLKDAPARTCVTALQDAIKDREVVRCKGRHAYIVYPDGIGNSRLTSALIDRTLATRGTARNWNTVLKLAALADAM